MIDFEPPPLPHLVVFFSKLFFPLCHLFFTLFLQAMKRRRLWKVPNIKLRRAMQIWRVKLVISDKVPVLTCSISKISTEIKRCEYLCINLSYVPIKNQFDYEWLYLLVFWWMKILDSNKSNKSFFNNPSKSLKETSYITACYIVTNTCALNNGLLFASLHFSQDLLVKTFCWFSILAPCTVDCEELGAIHKRNLVA